MRSIHFTLFGLLLLVLTIVFLFSGQRELAVVTLILYGLILGLTFLVHRAEGRRLVMIMEAQEARRQKEESKTKKTKKKAKKE